MLHYARSDTHYLLSIYDHLRLALSSKTLSIPSSSEDDSSALSPLEEVFNRSIQVSSTVFALPPYDHETGHFESGFLIPLSKSGQLKSYSTALAVPTLPIKTGWGPGEVRLEVLRDLMKWRESAARKEDESTRYVMGIQGVLQVVEQCKRIQVGGSAELVRVLGGTRGGVSEVVRKNKEELVNIITKTIERVEGLRQEGEDHEMMGESNLGVPANLNDGFPAFEPAVKPIQGLWDQSGAAPVASTSTSSFFGSRSAGSSSQGVPSSSTSVASTSSFFGSQSTSTKAKTKTATTTKGKNVKGKQVARSTEEERLAAVRKVHESLVLGGGLARVSFSFLPLPPFSLLCVICRTQRVSCSSC